MMRSDSCWLSRFLVLALLAPSAHAGPPTVSEAERPVTQLSLEDLASLEVTSVSKKPEPRFVSPAAVHVITAEDIRRIGATSIAEALRLAPGVEVARINSNQWAIGVRGFASRLSRALLVLIDGRSVYSPLFAGVYWEIQDIALEDVDRIEVIRGPGGTLWGSNAVNGVINIITKSAEASQGGLGRVLVGSEDRFGASLRYGGAAGEHGYYRAYAKYIDRDDQFHPDGSAFDDWRLGRAGFRADWEEREGSAFTLQGDLYVGRLGQRTSLTTYEPPFVEVVDDEVEVSGGNLLGRWQKAIPEKGTLTAQTYYDRTRREEATFTETRDTFDVDVQHRLGLSRQELVAGLGYRVTHGDTTGVSTVAFEPAVRNDQIFSGFLHDEIALRRERLKLAVGSKLEHNDYSGFEVQPSASLLWTPSGRQTVWTSIARAVRTPSPVDQDVRLTVNVAPEPPTFARVLGDPHFSSEELIAVQAGYRVRPERALVDLAVFYNRYDDLFSLEPGALFGEDGRLIFPFDIDNQIEGSGRGGELVVEADVLPSWRVSGSYSYLDLDLHPKPGSHDTTQSASAGASPRHQGYVRSSLRLPHAVVFDVLVRGVGEVQTVPAYASLDARIGWHPRYRWEIAVTGQNLLDPRHLEFGGSSSNRGRGSGSSDPANPFVTEISRAVYAEAIARW